MVAVADLENLFLPSVRLAAKVCVGTRVRRKYDRPQTPLDRVRLASDADPAHLRRLIELQQTLDPFVIASRIEQGLARAYELANHAVRAAAPWTTRPPLRRS